jgi:tRNA dimethylallyltransferase
MTKFDKTLIIITGPTAVGKTTLSIELAKLFQTEIISADSRQFYKEMKIGTAPPSFQELREVKHHFIGHLSIHNYYNVSKYEEDAIPLINKLFLNHDKLIMVGGSGLYINAVILGIDDLPDPEESTRNYLKSIYTSEGIASLRQMLKELDAEYYEQVDLGNHTRLLRALEVCLTTGKKFSSLRKNSKKTRDFNYIFIGLDRERPELFEIINQRVDRMIFRGLVKEAKELYKFKDLNALNTVGYKEIFDSLDGKISLTQATENIKTNTRRYAKRQLTWFKKIPEIEWFHPDEKKKIQKHINQNCNN